MDNWSFGGGLFSVLFNIFYLNKLSCVSIVKKNACK